MFHDIYTLAQRPKAVAGVDGARGGWLVAVWDGNSCALDLVKHAETLFTLPVAFMTVDMPIGLPDRGARICDLHARRGLPGKRKSCVFPAPRRYMLNLPDYERAQQAGKTCEGKGLSKQAWNLIPKIAELDAAIIPAMQSRIRETHPELAFNARIPSEWGLSALASKKSSEGSVQRCAILRATGLPEPKHWFDSFPRKQATNDDILDTLIATAVAYACLYKTASTTGKPREYDATGLAMEIWW